MGAFSLSQVTVIAGPPAAIHPHLDDLRKWRAWSPWEDLDPQLQRSYSGPDHGPGAHYRWQGNKKAGVGTMTITASSPERVDIDLEFIEPFKANHQSSFVLHPEGENTRVTWSMSGERGLVMALLGKLIFDKAVAKDFDKGLASLKALVERESSR